MLALLSVRLLCRTKPASRAIRANTAPKTPALSSTSMLLSFDSVVRPGGGGEGKSGVGGGGGGGWGGGRKNSGTCASFCFLKEYSVCMQVPG